MYDLGDELTIESLRIPWLIWIQVVVLFLLIFLIYCLTNLSDHNSSSISSSSSSQLVPNETQKDKPLPNHNFTTRAVTNLSQNHRSAESRSIKGEIDAGTSRRIDRGEEELADNEDSLVANAYLQPCHYFRLARLAFLKCLGLDSTTENSTSRRRKRKEQ